MENLFWSRSDLMRLTGWNRNGIDRLLSAGLPHTKAPGRGAEYRVEHGPALRWLIDHLVVENDDDVPDLTGARARLAVAQEELVRLKIGRESGELVPAAEVRKLREVENLAFRDRLRSVPMTMAERLLDAANKGARAPEIAALLLAEIDVSLQDLADMEVVVEPGEADDAAA